MYSCILHGWSSHDGPCPSCERTVRAGTDLPVELMVQIPGPKGSSLIEEDDAEELIRLLKLAEDKGEVPAHIIKAFEDWAAKHNLRFAKEEAQAASVVFMAGMAYQSQSNQKEGK